MGGWHEVWEAIRGDFADLTDWSSLTILVVRLAVASVLGGLLGYQRARAGKAAGVRTHMLVSLGAAFFVLVPILARLDPEAVGRAIQGVITGVGFLGAGAILKPEGSGGIRGLTTAADIWLTAAIGVAAGAGLLVSSILCAIFALFILAWTNRAEEK